MSESSKPFWAADFYESALRQVQARTEKLQSLKEHAERAIEAEGIFARRNGGALDITALSVSADIGVVGGVCIHINCKDFAEIVPLRRWLRQHGYKFLGHEDYVEIGRRQFKYGPINVLAFVPTVDKQAEGGGCRVVQTGVKQVPVYKIVCDSDEDKVATAEQEAQ